MTVLKELYLDNNQIDDLSAVVGMRHLRVLTFANNQVSDLTPLKVLRKLKTLVAVGNSFPEEQVDQLRELLPECEIIHR